MSAIETQVGGTHYKDMPIQPIDFITKNNIPYIEGNIIKYLCRWRNKNGVQDLEKAKHYLEMLIEMEQRSELQKQVANRVEELRAQGWEEQQYEFTWKFPEGTPGIKAKVSGDELVKSVERLRKATKKPVAKKKATTRKK